MKARYLAYFSYIGTHFRSSQKLWLRKETEHYPDPQSIQGLIELGLQKLKPLHYPTVILSSRTDGGVHALNNTAHIDLHRFGEKIYDPHYISYALNTKFYKNGTSIHINKCLRVNDNFNARYLAKSRTYLYRFAVIKEGVTLPDYSLLASYMPVEEWKRCHFMRYYTNKNFDIEKFREAAQHLVGYHDFTSFRKSDKNRVYKHNRREIYSIDVSPGKPLVVSHRRPDDDIFVYWEVKIRGRAFVHNQIRRMIGALVAVANGKLPPEEIKVMVQVPSRHSWHPCMSVAPPDGLYLCDIEYDPKDLVYTGDSTREVIVDEEDEC